MGYEVHLDVFEGPFDLLLQLISKRKLDVTEVDLAEITADFLASLQGIDQLDLEAATRFLVVAATLIELKAARLLPRQEADELEDLLGEARDMLYARLLEYRAFRDAAAVIAERIEAHEGLYGREVPLDADLRALVPDAPLLVTVDQLARMAALATAPRPEPTIRIDHIRRSFISIQDAATQVLQHVSLPGDATSFNTVIRGQRRGDAVVFFLAMLELYKLGHLQLEQDDHRSEMTLSRRESSADLTVLSELDHALDDDDALNDEDALTDDDALNDRAVDEDVLVTDEDATGDPSETSLSPSEERV